MKYIEKDYKDSSVVTYEKELEDAEMNEDNLKKNSVHPHSDGAAIYDMVKSMPSFSNLKQVMLKDQGGICCYCGQKLRYEGHPYQAQFIVEHVFPKEKYRTIAGEYSNLLLSCRPSDKEEESRNKLPKKDRQKLFHCDKSKECDVLNFTPLEPDIATHFSYDEFGKVLGDNPKAQDDCKTLNLNCDWLVRRRKAAIEGQIFDDNYNLFSDETLLAIKDLVMNKDNAGEYQEFCFAIKSAIERIEQ